MLQADIEPVKGEGMEVLVETLAPVMTMMILTAPVVVMTWAAPVEVPTRSKFRASAHSGGASSSSLDLVPLLSWWMDQQWR